MYVELDNLFCIFNKYYNFFFSLYNNIHHPSKLTVGVDFYCFKDKIEPKWEDPVCANGGKWTISCARGKADTVWLYTVCFYHRNNIHVNIFLYLHDWMVPLISH